MVRRWFIVLLVLLTGSPVAAQEVLLPLQRRVLPPTSPQRALKAQPDTLHLPFFDDFAGGSLALWQDAGGATVTFDVSPLAPTVGVATLDALDAEGNLYSHASTELFMADTLTSLPISFDSLTPSGQVMFSFWYLPGGGYGNMWERVGEAPDPQDSLFLDFYRAVDSTWVTVWSRGGISVDTLMARTGTDWQYVEIRIDDSAYYRTTEEFPAAGMRVRFRNYASLESSPKAGKAGNGDYWHLDYVRLYQVHDGDSVYTIPATRDVAFAAPAPSMLHDYRAMPYRQYTPAAMASSLAMTITNRYYSPLATHYTYAVLDSTGATLHTYDGGFENAPPFLVGSTYQTTPMHATPTVAFSFPTMTAPTDYTVVHVIKEGTGGDDFPLNDTVRYRQCFGDYYAYDDGTAENGYGLTSTASRLYLAYRFDLSGPDTLTAVDIWFNSTLDSGNAAIPFYLTLWSVGADGRPTEVLYRDEGRRQPHCGGFSRYILEAPVVVDSALFVGFEQTGNDYINLGFDRSFNTSERIWYLTGTEWQQSILSGSLMLRPAFGSAAAVGIEDSERRGLNADLSIYPNPASEWVRVEGLPVGTRIELYDTFGRRVYQSFTSQLSTISYPNGLYLLRATSPEGEVYTHKLLIHH